MSISFEIFKMAAHLKGQSQFSFNRAQNVVPGLYFDILKRLNGTRIRSGVRARKVRQCRSVTLSARHHARPSRPVRVFAVNS